MVRTRKGRGYLKVRLRLARHRAHDEHELFWQLRKEFQKNTASSTTGVISPHRRPRGHTRRRRDATSTCGVGACASGATSTDYL